MNGDVDMDGAGRRLTSLLTVPIVALALVALGSGSAGAQQLVYQPSVSVGGFVGAGSFQAQLQAAQAQRPQDRDAFQRSPIQDFEQSLQRSILSQLSRQIVQSQFGVRGENLDLQEEGTFQLGDFTVNVTPGIDGIQIRVANVITGNETVVTVPNF